MNVNEKNRATINDVAAAAGVSKKTVSRVINNEVSVKAETREKVQLAMKALNYFPSLSARSLASKRSYLVAMLYLDREAYYLRQLQRGLLDHFATRGFSLLMHSCEGDIDTGLQAIENKARYMNIDGFVLVPPLVHMPPVIALLKRLGKPYIRIAPTEEYDGFSEVLCNDEQAAFDLTEHFIQQGHTRIGFVQGAPDCLATITRFNGYKRALLEHNIPVRDELIVEGSYDFQSGIAAGKILVSQALYASGEMATVIFCSNDDMAAGVLHVAHECGIQVPKQLAIAGYDDSPLSQQTWPALTSVRQPNRRMAEIAANKLIDTIERVEGVEYPQNIQCEIVYRTSTEGWKAPDSLTSQASLLLGEY